MVFGGGELRCDGSEAGLEFGVSGLGGERLGPVQAEIKMAAAVVDAGADLARGALVVFEELAVGFVEGLGEDFCLGVFLGDAEVFEGSRERKKLAEGIPAEEVFLGELLHVFRCGAAGAGFEKAAAVHERDD